MSTTTISNLNNKNSINGSEKIPVSGSGNPAITPNLLGTHFTTDINAVRTALNTADYDNFSTLQFAGNATNTATLFGQIIETANGRLLGLISQFGSTLGDFTQFALKGAFSDDGGKTWGTPFTIITFDGSEVANAIPSAYVQANGTIVLLFWRDLVNANPRLTTICKKTSTDNGATWSSTSTVYTVGAYSAPANGRIFKANDGTLYYAFNQWIGGPGGLTDYQYGSQNANYKGQLLKSTDDGTTWTHPAIDITDGTNNAVLEPGIFQYEDAANGTVGRAVFYYRSRGGFVGMAYSDDNFATWTTGAPSTLVASNHDCSIIYDVGHNTLIAHVVDITPWDARRNLIKTSYDQGVTWYTKMITSEVPSGYATAAAGEPYIWRGMVFFPYYKSNSTVTRYDDYIFYSKLSNFMGINITANHTPLYNGEINTLSAATRITAGLTVDDLIIGTTSKFNSTDILDVKNSTTGDTRLIFRNDDNNQTSNILLNFRRTVNSASPSNTCPIGSLMFNDKIAIAAKQNNLGTNSADINFQTDTGSGLVSRTQFTNAGQWLYGDDFTGMHSNAIAQWKATSRLTEINMNNNDNNTNYNYFYAQKLKNGSGNLGAGTEVLRIDANTLAFIKLIANSTVVGGFSNIDFAFFGADAAQTVAERFRITGAGAMSLNATNTAGGTTGNQTINKPTGTVNFAASATSITVTNSLVTTSSLVFCTIRTNDATATIKNVVPGSGSFVITLSAAATAETSVGFFVLN